jgi:hypothetical protein
VEAGADVLDVGDPAGAPDGGRDEGVEACGLERLLELRAEAVLEQEAGEEEAGVCGLDPRLAVGGKAACGDEQVDVGVERHRAGPGVEDGEDRRLSADPLGVLSEAEDCVSGLVEEERVDEALVGAGDGAELGGQSDRDQVVAAGGEQVAPALDPALGAVMPAGGAVAVAAGVVGEVVVAAAVALVDVAAEGLGAAGGDVAHRPQVGGEQGPAEAADERRAGGPEDLPEGRHDRGLTLASDRVHEAVDRVGGRRAELAGEVRVLLSRSDTRVAEVDLDHADVDAELEQVGRVGVAQGVDVGLLADAALAKGVAESALRLERVTGPASVAMLCSRPLRVGAGNSHRGERCVFQCSRSIVRSLGWKGT